MVKTLKIKPPSPDDLCMGLFGDGSATGEITGLRSNKNESYHLFLRYFLKAAVGLKEWRCHSTIKLISEFVDETREAFGVISYCNGYNVWCSIYQDHLAALESNNTPTTLQEDSSEAVSSLESADSITYKFTGSTRGVKRHQGWSQEGMTMYNQIVDILAKQRNLPFGKDLESDVLSSLIRDSGSKKRLRSNQNSLVKPASKLTKLLDQVRNVTKI